LRVKKGWKAPRSSPGLNPVDYSIWGALQQLVYRRSRIRDVEHLKEVLQTCWEQIGQDVIHRATGQFRKRLSLVVATGGGNIEHRFDWCFWCYTWIIILILRELMWKYRPWTTEANSLVYSAPLSILSYARINAQNFT